jgi:hypothetical protein
MAPFWVFCADLEDSWLELGSVLVLGLKSEEFVLEREDLAIGKRGYWKA